MSHHLTVEEREVISQMHYACHSQAAIGRRLRRHRSTVCRELARNGGSRGYVAVAAQARAEWRRSIRPRIRKLDRPEVLRYVKLGLWQFWSPQEIAGRSRRDFPHDRARQISHQAIYAWIAAEDAAGGHWRRYLRRSGKRRGRAETRGQLRDRVSIDGRPGVVDRRGRYGDWEGDTLVGAGRRGGAVTLVERKSGYLLLGKVANLKAATVRQTAATLVRPTAPALRKTLTLDNGKEFAEHKELAAETGLAVYFAKPYCAWQRGTNENTNGLIRQFFPKRTDLASVPERRFTKVQHLLNTRPRRRLGYRTPHEVLASRLRVAIET